MIQALLITHDRRSLLPWPEARDTWKTGGSIVWLDISAPTEEEVTALGAEFSLHPAVVRACLHPEHRPRLKEFKSHLLLVLNGVGRGGGDAKSTSELGHWRTLELNVIIGERYLLTVHPEVVPAVSLLWQRWGHDEEGRPTVEYLLYSLCESVTNGYYVVLDRLDKYIDEAENLIFRGQVQGRVVDKLFALKRHVLYLRRVLGPQRDALGALMRREFPGISPDARPFFLDVYEHNLRLFDLMETYRDLISSSLDAYLSTVSNQMNRIMQTLTIVSTIMLPLTLVSGVFGMNFGSMPLVAASWGFWAVMAGMGAIVLALILYFRRRRWM